MRKSRKPGTPRPPRCENEAWTGRHRIGNIPMTVISNDYGDNYGDEEERTNVAA